MAESIDIRVYKDELRRHAEAFAASIGVDPGNPVAWVDPVREVALRRGVARGEGIREEIEERRPRIRRAASLAERIAHAAGDEPIAVVYTRPTTIAGISILRARRIQLRSGEPR